MAINSSDSACAATVWRCAACFEPCAQRIAVAQEVEKRTIQFDRPGTAIQLFELQAKTEAEWEGTLTCVDAIGLVITS
jgi:hypothetical protein